SADLFFKQRGHYGAALRPRDVDTPLDAATGKSAEVDADRALTAGRDRRGPGDVAQADPGRVRLGRRDGQEQGGAGHLHPKEGRGRRRVTVGKGGGEPLE